MPVADRNTFVELYAGQPRWEIGRPQRALLNVADRITGSVLDCGCGSGENALFLAGRGQKVTGIDFLAEPVRWAKQKADERGVRGVTATFVVMDALALKALLEVFDNAIDSGLFHVFSDEDRRRYVEGLATVLKPGGRLFLLCFSDAEPGEAGPRRVSKKEIEDAFAERWAVETIEPTRYEVRPDQKDASFSGRWPEGVVRGRAETLIVPLSRSAPQSPTPTPSDPVPGQSGVVIALYVPGAVPCVLSSFSHSRSTVLRGSVRPRSRTSL